MAAGSFRKYLDTFALSPSGEKIVTLDMTLVASRTTCRLLLIANWKDGTDAVTTGLKLTRLPGTGPDPDPDSVSNKYATDDPNTVDKPTVANPPPGLAAHPTNNEYSTPFSFIVGETHPLQRIKIENDDPTNPVDIQLWGNQ